MGFPQDRQEEDLTNRAKRDVSEIALTSGAALAGYALGGSIGAVVGNVTTPLAIKAVDFGRAALAERQRQRQALVVEYAASDAGMDENALVERLLSRPEGEELLVSALDACQRLADKQRLTLVARALSRGAIANDDTPIDEERLLIDITKRLSVPAIHLLDIFTCTSYELGLSDSPNDQTRDERNEAQLKQVAPQFDATLDALVAELEGVGALVAIPDSGGSFYTGPHQIRQWRISTIGKSLMDLLHDPQRVEDLVE